MRPADAEADVPIGVGPRSVHWGKEAFAGPALPSRLPCPKAVTAIALPGIPHLTRFATRAKRPSSV